MAKRPPTMREMQSVKATKDNSGEIKILNISKQLVKIHLKPPKGVDFYIGAQDINIRPGKIYTARRSRVWMEQVERLSKQRVIQVVSVSEK